VWHAQNTRFRNRSTGRSGPITSPPSMDLTPMDSFMWEYVKSLSTLRKSSIYITCAREIKWCSNNHYASLRRTWDEIEYRLDVCRTTNGAHVEIY
jgi:hypothetical protein